MDKRKKNSLNKKMLRSIVLFAAAIVVTTGFLVCSQYYYTQMKNYSDQAFTYAHIAADFIDGDRVLEYVETEEKDDYYYEVQDFLNVTQLQTSMKYYYVFVPYENDLVYVWDADNYEGFCELGYHESYMSDESKAAAMEAFRQDPVEKINVQKDATYGHIASAYSPLFNSSGEPVALIGVDLSIPDLRKAMLMYMLVIVGAIMGITLIAQTVFYSAVDKKVIKPISMLTKSTREMIGNLERDEAVDLKIDTGDEIEELADAVVAMDEDLREYIIKLSTVTKEKERIGTELYVAKKIQAGMLPQIFPPFPDRNEFELYASMEPAKEVGGDFYDFYMIDDDHIALVMADVSDKGVPAALFMVVSKILIKNYVQAGYSPGEALKRVNTRLLEGSDAGLFVTVWLAVIDLSTGKGIVTNAGHEHPLLKKNGSDFEIIKYKHSPAVSTLEGITFSEHEITLGEGDSLFVYTDGLTDASNADQERFGEQRLVDTLNSHKDVKPEEMLPAVKADIEAFVGDAPQFDDMTMMYFEYRGKN